MDLQRLDGPRLTARSGKTRQLVIILHGYGADGADLISLGRQWQQLLPDAEFVAPNAPQFCQNPPMGYQWFPLKVTERGVESTPQERWQGAVDTAPVVEAFIEAELQRTGLQPSDLALVGFSQGAMMALHTGLRGSKTPASIVSFSGMLLGVDQLDSLSAKPPVFLAHGSLDDIVPFAAMGLTKAALESVQINVTPYVEQGMAHGIDGEATWLAGEFLAKNFSF
ncbi:MAG: phospholipase [Hyphomicrobiaceae bacterium]|nr:phospholipase [Hyphomicrobiaceae bacterium]